MDACLAVEREVEKVLTKFNGIKDHSNRVLQELCNDVQALQDEYDNCPSDHELTAQQSLIIKQTITKVRDIIQRLATEHRDLHSTVSKVGKAIDRNFVSDFTTCYKSEDFSKPENAQLIDKVICQHFYRQGMLDIAESILKDAGVTMEEEKTEPFTEINKILNSLKSRNLDSALEWAEKNRHHLESQNSSLEFKLHRLRFIDLLSSGNITYQQAVQYARAHFQPFAKKHETDLQNLMGIFLYLPQGIMRSPYARFLEPTLWSDLIDAFIRDACTLMGYSVESPLSVSINAGCQALPALLNIKQVMQQRQVSGIWTGKDELPIEIDLGQEHQYHSIFACPILRQQSSDLNPPMRLVCGHVISKDALMKLSNNANKLKCPYCPMEQTTAEAKLIHF